MDNVINFLYVFFNADVFFIILITLILILLVVLIYLIEVSRRSNNVSEVAVTNEVPEEVPVENEGVMPVMSEATDKNESVETLDMDETEKVINEELSNIVVNEAEKVTNEELSSIEVNEVEKVKEPELVSQEEVSKIEDTINPIEAYEKDEEKNAVISTKELENIEKERNELYGVENNAKLIEEYETEQENKAIISYSELLKNAKSLELNYIETPREEEDGPVIKQVEIKEQPLKGVSYAAEEEYLRILKEFRKNLMTDG